MHGQITGPRVLLKHLREAMADSLGPQERLNRIVQQIAAAMTAQVCSVYALRSDDVLELFATYGLNEQAVHNSQLKIGEGLVGTIAASGQNLNLSDARQHPSFQFLPETGEEIYHSFLGVPMKRSGNAMGVLVVQTIENKDFAEEEVEALETAAMVLSDLIASEDLKGLTRQGKELARARPLSTTGLGLAGGIGIGNVVLHEPRVVITRFFNKNAEEEMLRLASALKTMRASVDAMLNRKSVSSENEEDLDHIDILESYRMFANDRGWVRRIEEAISDGLTAEAAVKKVSQENRDQLLKSQDPYLRERLNDLDDLARRLLKLLLGESSEFSHQGDDSAFVVVARAMGAAELLDYDSDGLKGLVLTEATATSHVVIVARAMGISVVGSAGKVVESAEHGDKIIVDGFAGVVHLRPLDELKSSYAEQVTFQEKRAAEFDKIKDLPAISRDNVRIELMLNAGLSMDLPQLEASGADGIGLFRTELQFMISSALPRLDEQTRFYKSVLDAAADKPVTFRTLDIGGDKVLPYLRTVNEDNPALGWRAIRLSIDRPGLLRIQLRALLKASIGKELRVKLPMVTTTSEIDQVKTIFNKEVKAQAQFGHELPSKIELGAMIEVPNLLWQLDELMNKVDFVSVGSNDLFQFMTASDRTNSYLANRYQPLSRPFLRSLRSIVLAAERNNTPFQLCGELAGDPLSAMALIGIGYRKISMPPAAIGPVKLMIKNINVAELMALTCRAISDSGDTQTIQELLNDYADQNGIPL